MGDSIPPAGDTPAEAVVRAVGLVTMAAGMGALTGVVLPAATGPLARVVAAATVVRGAALSYVAPHPASAVERVRGAVPVGDGGGSG
jgi:hypothetical protein